MKFTWLINPAIATLLFWVVYLLLGRALYFSSDKDLDGSISSGLWAITSGLVVGSGFILIKQKQKKLYAVLITWLLILVTGALILYFDPFDFPPSN